MNDMRKISVPAADEVQAMALADIGRHISRLNLECDLIAKEERDAGGASPGSLSDDMGDALYDLSREALGRSPKTVADAAVLLLAVSQEFDEVMHDIAYRGSLMDAWLAMGRVIKFLAKAAKSDPAGIGSKYWSNTIDGLDRRLAVEWWAERFMQAGGTFILNEKGGVGYYSPQEDAEQTERFRLLFEEHAPLHRETIAKHVGELVWKGLGHEGIYGQVIPGKRWAVTWQPNRTDETCIITTQIVTERPWPTKETLS